MYSYFPCIYILPLCQYRSSLRVHRIFQPVCTGVGSSFEYMIVPLEGRYFVKDVYFVIKAVRHGAFGTQPYDVQLVGACSDLISFQAQYGFFFVQHLCGEFSFVFEFKKIRLVICQPLFYIKAGRGGLYAGQIFISHYFSLWVSVRKLYKFVKEGIFLSLGAVVNWFTVLVYAAYIGYVYAIFV